MSGVDPDPATTSELRYELPGGAVALFTDRSHGSFAMPPDSPELIAAEVRGRVLSLAPGTTGARPCPPGTRRDRHPDRLVPRNRQAARRPSRRRGRRPGDLGQGAGRDGRHRRLPAGGGGRRRALWRCSTPAGGAWPPGCSRRGSGPCGSSPGPDPLSAVIGPGAGPCCYEVGPEVHEALSVAREGPTIDLPAVARSRLAGGGRGGRPPWSRGARSATRASTPIAAKAPSRAGRRGSLG